MTDLHKEIAENWPMPKEGTVSELSKQLGYVLADKRWFPTWLWGWWMRNDKSRVLRWLWKLRVKP